MPRPISAERIAEAHSSIDKVFLGTPVIESPILDRKIGCHVIVKDESANPIGSFKGRGADYFCAVSSMRGREIVCASAGNFGQGLAWGMRRQGGRVTIIAAATANALKIARMRELGGNVIIEGADFDAANEAAKAYGKKHGVAYIEDADHPEVAEGAGTIARELTEGGHQLDAMFVPVGGGALINGIATWLKHASPKTRVIGVCAEGAPAYAQSFAAGRVIPTTTCTTIADGIAVRVPVASSLETMRRVVDEVVTVTDDEILDAVRLLYRSAGIIAEGTGGAALAALIRQKDKWRGKTVALPNCAKNLTDEQKAKWLGITPA
jgi:threonine dehydratase